MARLGIGRFTVADPDTFELANFNRQYGATISTLGRPKAEVMAEIARQINPEVDLRLLTAPVDSGNVEEFLREADFFVDGIDAFEIEARRILFRAAAGRGIWAITAGPLGFGTAWVTFDPQGISFDRYFDLSDRMGQTQKFVAFMAGVAPALLHLASLDRSCVDLKARRAPSVGLSCQLAAGVMGAEAVKILLKWGKIYAAPYYHQFDPYLGRFVRGRLLWGNRHPLQRLKRWWAARLLTTPRSGR